MNRPFNDMSSIESRVSFAASFLSGFVWLSSCSHRRGAGFVRPSFLKENAHFHVQGLRQRLQHGNRHVFFAPFDTADIGTVDRGLKRKPFLRQAALDAQLAKVPTDEFASIHSRAKGHIERLTIDGLIVPYFAQRAVVACTKRGSWPFLGTGTLPIEPNAEQRRRGA